MNLQEVYAKTGGNYEEAIMRFSTEARVVKFMRMFLRDPSYEELKQAVSAADWDAAFRAVHTMKGVAGNMSFTGLYTAASALTEALRGGKALTDGALYEEVRKRYDAIAACVSEYIELNP